MHNDCSPIEDVLLSFLAHLIDIFLFLMGVELRCFIHRECLEVSGLCNL